MERRTPDAPPSLVIVIDEFATLAKEVPEFVEGVVDVAQRGRSLGVHLVLATQRPGGVVSDNIRANVEPADRAADGGAHRVRGHRRRHRRRADRPRHAGPRVRARRPGRAERVPGRLRRRHHDDRRRRARRSSCATSRFGHVEHGPAPARSSTAYGTVATDLEELVKARQRGRRAPAAPAAAVAVAARAGARRSPLDDAPAHARIPSSTFGVIDEPSLQRRTPLTHDFENDGSLLDLRRQRRGQDGAAAHDRGRARGADPARPTCTSTASTSPPAA